MTRRFTLSSCVEDFSTLCQRHIAQSHRRHREQQYSRCGDVKLEMESGMIFSRDNSNLTNKATTGRCSAESVKAMCSICSPHELYTTVKYTLTWEDIMQASADLDDAVLAIAAHLNDIPDIIRHVLRLPGEFVRTRRSASVKL